MVGGTVWSRFPGVCSALRGGNNNRDAPFFLICGLNVLQTLADAQKIADEVAESAENAGVPAFFKASFDKANRTSANSFRGPGIEKGLRMLEDIGKSSGLPLLTDIHETWQASIAAEVVDALQIPAMLCRQTSLLRAASETGKVVNIKKGQFASPAVMRAAVRKACLFSPMSTSPRVMVCERGTSFGYDRLVVDFTSIREMREENVPIVLDATHGAQRPPCGQDNASSGHIEHVLTLARAGAAAGVDGIFLETHVDPPNAPCDSAVQLPVHRLRSVLLELARIAHARSTA